MKLNWAEGIGLWLNGIAPLLLSVGLVLLFIEFKTRGLESLEYWVSALF